MVNDIVIECGNSRYQETLDRYVVDGADSPLPLASSSREIRRTGSEPSSENY